MKLKAKYVPLMIQCGIVIWLFGVSIFLMTNHMIPPANEKMFYGIFGVLLTLLNAGALGKIAELTLEKEIDSPQPEAVATLKKEPAADSAESPAAGK